MTTNNVKPRVRFCWECGNKLWGNYFTEQFVEGHDRIMHKQCWKFRKIDEKIEYNRLYAVNLRRSQNDNK